jgi:hypothetical protein
MCTGPSKHNNGMLGVPKQPGFTSVARDGVGCNGRGKPTASSLSANGFPLMAGPNFQPSGGNPTVISILQQLADGPKNVPER